VDTASFPTSLVFDVAKDISSPVHVGHDFRNVEYGERNPRETTGNKMEIAIMKMIVEYSGNSAGVI
jgi:hypothetical protein